MRISLRSLLFAVLPFILLSGHASAGDQAESIAKFFLEPDVVKPAEMSYLGPGGGIGFVFGAIGVLATQQGQMPTKQALKEYAEKSDVLIENIVKQALITEFKQSGKFQLLESASSTDHRMTVTIRMYGFSIPHGFSSKLVPTLAVRCEWKTAQGGELRSVQKSVLPLGNPADSVELEQLNDPAVIRQLWQIAAEAVAKKIVNEVSQDL